MKKIIAVEQVVVFPLVEWLARRKFHSVLLPVRLVKQDKARSSHYYSELTVPVE